MQPADTVLCLLYGKYLIHLCRYYGHNWWIKGEGVEYWQSVPGRPLWPAPLSGILHRRCTPLGPKHREEARLDKRLVPSSASLAGSRGYTYVHLKKITNHISSLIKTATRSILQFCMQYAVLQYAVLLPQHWLNIVPGLKIRYKTNRFTYSTINIYIPNGN